jgi:hypothetical protein
VEVDEQRLAGVQLGVLLALARPLEVGLRIQLFAFLLIRIRMGSSFSL